MKINQRRRSYTLDRPAICNLLWVSSSKSLNKGVIIVSKFAKKGNAFAKNGNDSSYFWERQIMYVLTGFSAICEAADAIIPMQMA